MSDRFVHGEMASLLQALWLRASSNILLILFFSSPLTNVSSNSSPMRFPSLFEELGSAPASRRQLTTSKFPQKAAGRL
jgi:hypothetical protein